MMSTADATFKYGSVASAFQLRPKYSPAIATAHTTAVCDSVADRPSSTACVSVPRRATMKAAIIVLEWPGSKPCKAPSKIALGMNSQALPCCKRVENSVMESAL